MKKSFVILLSLTITGCGTYPLTVATSNVTKPVIIGNVPTIKGNHQKEFLNKVQEFSLNAEHSFVTIMNHVYTTREAAGKYDVGLLRIANGDDDSELIVIDKITFWGKKSESIALLMFHNSDYTKGFLDGAIYRK
ncbi:MAG: hypothetical protein RQ824_12305 [bacterium]|nr:hypothetical protein [bacterium]